MLTIRKTLFRIIFYEGEAGREEALKVYSYLKSHKAKICGNSKNKIKWYRKGKVEVETLLEILEKISFNKDKVYKINVSYKISQKTKQMENYNDTK